MVPLEGYAPLGYPEIPENWTDPTIQSHFPAHLKGNDLPHREASNNRISSSNPSLSFCTATISPLISSSVRIGAGL